MPGLSGMVEREGSADNSKGASPSPRHDRGCKRSIPWELPSNPIFFSANWSACLGLTRTDQYARCPQTLPAGQYRQTSTSLPRAVTTAQPTSCVSRHTICV